MTEEEWSFLCGRLLANGQDPYRLAWDDVADLETYWRTAPPTSEGVAILLATKGVRLPSREAQAESPAPSIKSESDARAMADALNSLGVTRGG